MIEIAHLSFASREQYPIRTGSHPEYPDGWSLDIYSPSPCGRGLGGGGSHSQALLSDNFQHSLDILKYIVVPKTQHSKSGKSLRGMSWFHGSYPHPLTPSRQGRGDFWGLHKRPNSNHPEFPDGNELKVTCVCQILEGIRNSLGMACRLGGAIT